MINKLRRKYQQKDPSVFAGPAGWVLTHTLCTIYTPEQSDSFKKYIAGLGGVFPCANCRKHFVSNLRKIDVNKYLESNDKLFEWSYIMHDLVNISKNVESPPYDGVKEFYFNTLLTHPSPSFTKIKPSIFAGPAGWVLIHSSAVKYSPHSDKHAYKMFIQSLIELYPDNSLFIEAVNKFDLNEALKSNDALFRWTYDVHDYISVKKRMKSPNFESIKKYYYETLGEKCAMCGD